MAPSRPAESKTRLSGLKSRSLMRPLWARNVAATSKVSRRTIRITPSSSPKASNFPPGGGAFLRQGDGPLGPSVPAHPCLIVWKGVRTRKMRVWKFRSDHRSINSGPFLPATSSSFSASRRLPGSKRVNSSKADADDATLIEPIRLQLA